MTKMSQLIHLTHSEVYSPFRHPTTNAHGSERNYKQQQHKSMTHFPIRDSKACRRATYRLYDIFDAAPISNDIRKSLYHRDARPRLSILFSFLIFSLFISKFSFVRRSRTHNVESNRKREPNSCNMLLS